VSRAAEIRVLAFGAAVRPVLEVSAAMGALALALRLGLEHVGAPAGLRLAVVVLFGAAAYLVLLAWREPALVREVWTLIRRRGR